MAWHLNEDVSYCELDGRLYFLDVQHDRYFQLSKSLEKDLLRHLEAPGDTGVNIETLARNNLMPQAPSAEYPIANQTPTPPRQSLLESHLPEQGIAFGTIRDVSIAVASMRWNLRRRSLKSILHGLVMYRHDRTRGIVSGEIDQRIAESVSAFIRIRPYIPIATCCLVDSLSLTTFLAKRGLHADLVIGVACDPFSAHAWVQHGSLVLNDTVGNTMAHVPIRVI